MTEITRQITENDRFRADIYQLLAALLRRAPNTPMLQFLADLEITPDEDNAMACAWLSLKQAASSFDPEQLEDEYVALFIGLGCGEIIPYASWFMTGTLMDKPLVLLRRDLMALGFEREADVKEPEDHVAAICEVMADLILNAPGYRQLAFYQQHLNDWIARFFEQLAKAPSARFYTQVAQLGSDFFEVEAKLFEQLSLDIPVNCPADKMRIHDEKTC